MLASAQWRTVSWRSGTKGRLKARFAAVRVRTADGPPQRIWDKGQRHLPGDEAWLIGEHRASGEKKYYLANLAAGMDLRSLAATIKALKEELGLDHFEGRSWHGLHRHALMAMIAYAFLQHRRLKKVRRGKKSTARPLNRRCRRSATPSSTSSYDQVLSDVRTADPGSPRKSNVSKSAKVVLGSKPLRGCFRASSRHRPAVRERRAIFSLALSSIADQHAAFHRQRERVARFVIAQTHSDFIDKSCLSIGRDLRQLLARYFRTAFEKNLDKRPRRWVSRLQRYDRGRYRDESRLRNKLQKLSFIGKRPCYRSRSNGAYGRFQILK